MQKHCSGLHSVLMFYLLTDQWWFHFAAEKCGTAPDAYLHQKTMISCCPTMIIHPAKSYKHLYLFNWAIFMINICTCKTWSSDHALRQCDVIGCNNFGSGIFKCKHRTTVKMLKQLQETFTVWQHLCYMCGPLNVLFMATVSRHRLSLKRCTITDSVCCLNRERDQHFPMARTTSVIICLPMTNSATSMSTFRMSELWKRRLQSCSRHWFMVYVTGTAIQQCKNRPSFVSQNQQHLAD